ncbi:MAG: UPF0182 family protein, partial [Nocardioides sp.]|nr:UPF0182 family protein [Nocardioides sp.]
MSDMSDDEQPEAPPAEPQRPKRSKAIWITLVAVLVLFLGFSGLASFWTEKLWFSSIGYGSVFSGLVKARVGLFLVFGLLMAVVVGVNIFLAYRFRPVFRPHSPEQVSLDRYRDAVAPIRMWLLVGISLLIGAFAGTTASGKWREFMLWRNGGDFDKSDPFFGHDIGFYVFDVPWLHFVMDYAMAVTIVTIMVVALVHYLYGGIRLQSQQDRLSGAAAAQLSVLAGFFVLSKAADYWLDRFDLLNQSGSLITGIGYTDDNAVLPAKNILMFIAVICAVLFFANVVRRTWLLPTVGLGLLVLSSVLLGLIWPGIVQQFQVEPSQADKEAPYIQKNIDATRAAYDIDDAVYTDYSGQTSLTQQQQAEEVDTIPGIRLVDPALVRATFEQIQQSTRYYSVAEVLDVDRYTIDGQDRDLVLGVRELNQDGLPEDSKNWTNLHTVYTHGYGMIAAYGNQRGKENKTQSTSGEPVWAEEDIPPKGALTDMFPDGYRPQIYFGENSPEYSIVGKVKKDDPDVELDLPAESDTGEGGNTYDGEAGVGVGSTFRQILYAWKFGEPNIVLSGR